MKAGENVREDVSIGLPLLVAFLHLACLVCLLQGEDERLKTSKVSNQLEDPENPHNTHLDYDALAILILEITSLMIFPVFPMIWKSSRPSSKRER